MRHRYFVRTQYGVIKIKSLSYTTLPDTPISIKTWCIFFAITHY
ncbi:hypothetical protein ARSQ2_01952 [Arsenophonus endosymbiont of Bemisia tabaci Q2]|nr:hypothetical protein ARSQ2_01952 [Arsenophonus endosymbiont of Bemisia tabaci Q2]